RQHTRKACPTFSVHARAPSGTSRPPPPSKKPASSFASSRASCRPRWDNEPLGEAQRSHVQVARAAELPAIIACGFQSIDKVVVQPEFELLCIYRRQRITDQVPSEKLLVPRHELRRRISFCRNGSWLNL